MNYNYVIAYMGQKKMVGLSDAQIIGITGVYNYTPEIIRRLEKMFHDGDISSRPVTKEIPSYSDEGKARMVVEWISRDNDLHRSGDLPAVETENTSSQWFKDGLRTRENGPAVVDSDGVRVAWYKDGAEIINNNPNLEVDGVQYDKDPDAAVAYEVDTWIKTYVDTVKKNFPNASPEYIGSEAIAKLREHLIHNNVDVNDEEKYDDYADYDDFDDFHDDMPDSFK